MPATDTALRTRQRATAIIVGAEPRIVVTVARSLHRHGVRCIVAVPPGQSLRVSSKAISATFQLVGSVAEAATLLRLLAAAEQAAWIAPTSDGALSIVGHDYDQLSRVAAIGCPRPKIVARVLDKSRTLAAAERCGVPIPKSAVIPSVQDLDSAVSALRFPLVAKPGDKGAKPAHDFKTRTFASEGELRAAFAANASFGAGLLFQQYEPGHGVGVELLMHSGAPVAHFQHRRLSELPPSGGVAVVAISEPPDSALLEHSVRLLRELEWEGVAMVEFRHDPTSGTAALMEVNGRFWGSIALPVAAGVDFPLYAWQIAQGIQPVPPGSYRHGLRVRWTAGALQRFGHGEGLASGQPGIVRGSTHQLLSDFHPSTRSALWSWSDPMPALQETTSVLTRALKDGVKSVLSAMIPRPAIEAMKSARDLPRDRRAHYLRRRVARSLGMEPRQRLPANVRSVLFVCHGNIMRSAVAAQFLRDALNASGQDHVRVSSAGTTTRVGRPADPRVNNAALGFGTSLERHRSQPLTDDLVDQSDVIFAMDDLNVVNIAATFPRARAKLMLFGGIDDSGEWAPSEIVDPYVATDDDVRSTVTRIHGSVDALHQALQRQSP